MTFNIFSQIYSFLLRGGLGFTGHPIFFHECRILQRNQFSFYQKYFYYYIGVSFGVSWLKYWTANVMLKILFSIHWNYYVSNSMWLIVLKTNVMIVTFNYSLWPFKGTSKMHQRKNYLDFLKWGGGWWLGVFLCHSLRITKWTWGFFPQKFAIWPPLQLGTKEYLIFSHLVIETESFKVAFFYFEIF